MLITKDDSPLHGTLYERAGALEAAGSGSAATPSPLRHILCGDEKPLTAAENIKQALGKLLRLGSLWVPL